PTHILNLSAFESGAAEREIEILRALRFIHQCFDREDLQFWVFGAEAFLIDRFIRNMLAENVEVIAEVEFVQKSERGMYGIWNSPRAAINSRYAKRFRIVREVQWQT